MLFYVCAYSLPHRCKLADLTAALNELAYWGPIQKKDDFDHKPINLSARATIHSWTHHPAYNESERGTRSVGPRLSMRQHCLTYMVSTKGNEITGRRWGSSWGKIKFHVLSHACKQQTRRPEHRQLYSRLEIFSRLVILLPSARERVRMLWLFLPATKSVSLADQG